MMRNVFSKTLYDLRWTVLAFSVGLALLAFFVLYIYPSVSNAQGGLLSGLNPETAKALLGNMALAGTPEGYLNIQLIAFQPLFIAVFLILVTSAAIAGEDDAKTLGMLLARPVPRWRILTEKALAIGLGMVVIIAALAAGALIGAWWAGVNVSYWELAGAVLLTIPFGLWLLGFGLFCSALFRSRMVAGLIVTGVVVFGYMLNSSTEFAASLVKYNRFWPFYYYSWGQPMLDPIKWVNAGILVAAGIVFFALALLAFNRREVMA
jgi:ABC-2 type transport system permease protein